MSLIAEDPKKQQIPLGYYKKDGTFIGKLGRDWQAAGAQIGDYVVTRSITGGVTIDVIGYTKNSEGDTIVDKIGYRRLARNNPETRKGVISEIPKALWKHAYKSELKYTGSGRSQKLSSRTDFVLNDKGQWIKKDGDTESDTDADTSGDVTITDESQIPGSNLKPGDVYFKPGEGYKVTTSQQVNQNQVNLDAINAFVPKTEAQKKQLKIKQDVKSLNFKDPEIPGSNEGSNQVNSQPNKTSIGIPQNYQSDVFSIDPETGERVGVMGRSQRRNFENRIKLMAEKGTLPTGYFNPAPRAYYKKNKKDILRIGQG
tara:strand:+ start:374 stop:1315 length:942 start_codon:yes stop_codon:yes gene_type:complete